MDADPVTWLAAHLSWLIWILLILWAPPVLYTMAIDVGILPAPGSGFLTLTDPALITGALQIALMAAALPGLPARRARSWQLLTAALAVWLAHFAWSVASRARLDGLAALLAPETRWPFGGLIAGAVVLLGVRRHFSREPVPSRVVAAP